MNRNSRNVIFQAPFGVGCAVMVAPCSFLPSYFVRDWLHVPMLAAGSPAMQPGFGSTFSALQLELRRRDAA
jgi:hypothetical protein